MADFEQATPEQKLQIASYFIMSSPPGEVKDVLSDVRVLVGDSTVLNETEQKDLMRNYNLSQFFVADAGDRKVIVSPYGEITPDTYLDPATGKVFVFDHLQQKVIGETDQKQELNDHMKEIRAAVQNEVGTYLESAYKSGRAVHAVYGSDDGKITVCISATNTRLTAFWTGGWRSRFHVDVSTPGATEISGSIRINVHYFEDGNVQLHTDFTKTAKIQVGDVATTAKAIAAAVDKLETGFQSDLEEMYVSMHSSTFKYLRRILPLTGQKMNWNPAAHAVAGDLANR